MTCLTLNRVPGNADLAADPSVQMSPTQMVGMMGVLNGLFGVFPDGPCKGLGPITAVFEQDGLGCIGGRVILKRFTRTDKLPVPPTVEDQP